MDSMLCIQMQILISMGSMVERLLLKQINHQEGWLIHIGENQITFSVLMFLLLKESTGYL